MMNDHDPSRMQETARSSLSAHGLLGLHGALGLPWKSLRTRVVLLALITVLLGIWSLLFYMSHVLRADMQRLLSEQQYSVAKLLADEIDREISQRFKALEDVADETPAAMARGPAVLQNLLEHHHHLPSLFNGGVLVIRADGVAIAETVPQHSRIGVNYRHIDSVAAALDEGKASVSRPVVGEKVPDPLIGLTVPIRDSAGRVVGAIAGVVNLAQPNFLDVFARNAYDWDGGYLLLVAPKHRLIVTSSDKKRALEVMPPKGVNPGIDRYLEGAEGYSIMMNPSGTEVLGSVKKIPVADWYVAVLLPTRTVFAPITAMEQRLQWAAILLSLMMGVAIWFILQRQLKPMLTAAHSLATLTLQDEQNLQPLPVNSHDEVGRLIEGFNRLLILLAQREEHLHLFSHIVEQSPESIMVTDLGHHIVYVNPAFCDSTGYTIGEVINQSPKLLRSGRTPKDTYDSLKQTLADNRTWRGEFINQRKDGSEYVEFALIAPLHQPDGRVTHYVAVKEDITEKRRIGAELDAYRRHLEVMVAERTRELETARKIAEAATAAKSSFLASMSHEIRTPMNAIIGLTRLVERNIGDAEQKGHLRKIDQSARYLLRIINDILDLSKIEAGRLEIVSSEFALADVFDTALLMVREKAEVKGLSLTSEIAPELAGVLVGDALRIEQILVNYLSNALKFTERGRIAVRASVAGENEAGILLRCEVEDSGLGIAQENLGRLFQDFEQIEHCMAHKYGGTGLGLSICRRLAELMGGEVGVNSTAGQGSLFWFTVRVRQAGKEVPAATAVPVMRDDDILALLRKKHHHARLLVVDDEPINLAVTAELLNEVWPEVDLAGNGAEALQLVKARDYDLVLMDMQMPVLDGLAATRAIRALPGRAAVKIIATTASGDPAYRNECLATGMNDFITKPVEPEDLFALILKWLSR